MNDLYEKLNLPATETINDICLFAEKLKERLEQKYKQYQVTVQQVIKNNGVKLTGISILKNGCITAPTIYLEDLFEQYQQGASLEHIICIILNQYVQIGHDLPILNFYNFSEVKGNICFRLINAEKNAELLQEGPHRLYHHLAIVYYILVSKDDTGIASIKINNQMLEIWQIDENALYKLALNNTPMLLGDEITTLSGLLIELLDETEQPYDDFLIEETEESENLLVVSNRCKMSGASVILYDGMLQRIAKRLGGNFYLLPSSIHEMICMPCRDCHDERELVTMVRQINAESVLEEEVLSDNVYCYDTAIDALRIIN